MTFLPNALQAKSTRQGSLPSTHLPGAEVHLQGAIEAGYTASGLSDLSEVRSHFHTPQIDLIFMPSDPL